MKYGATNKYGILLLGFLLIFGTYFIGRTVQFVSKEIAPGVVTAMVWGSFSVGVPVSRHGVGGGGDYHGNYQCPEIHFIYKASSADSGTRYSVRPEALSFKEYKPGEQVTVIFPSAHPELARIYSLGEFWFIPPYMIILAGIALLWSIGFLLVVFKPWKQMDEER